MTNEERFDVLERLVTENGAHAVARINKLEAVVSSDSAKAQLQVERLERVVGTLIGWLAGTSLRSDEVAKLWEMLLAVDLEKK